MQSTRVIIISQKVKYKQLAKLSSIIVIIEIVKETSIGKTRSARIL